MEQVLERENRIKSGVSTAIIAACICLIMWFYHLQMEIPVPLPEAHEVEIMVEPPPPPPDEGGSSGDGGGQASPVDKYSSDPREPAKAKIQTKDPDAVAQEKTPVKEVPDDGLSPAQMRAKRKAAEEEAIRNSKTTKPGPPGPGTTNNPPGGGKPGPGGVGVGISTTIGGRDFRGGKTTRDCHEAGTVVLEVQALPNGKIIFVEVDPGTNGSDCLIAAAKEILKNSSFNESDKTASGTITIIFKLK